ncbi:hypothetical protein [Kineothrix sedimenti]|uniref:Uncharacterized protein n=1 Tax=Kineothrix sedimenti TaxID=3123317 RepID=A0ABZ3EUY2_9FIRM
MINLEMLSERGKENYKQWLQNSSDIGWLMENEKTNVPSVEELELFMENPGELVGKFEKGKKAQGDTDEQMFIPVGISKGIAETVSNAVDSALGDTRWIKGAAIMSGGSDMENGVLKLYDEKGREVPLDGSIAKTTVNILGTKYEISEEDFDQPELKGKNRSGYCFFSAKKIVIEDLNTDDDWKVEPIEIQRYQRGNILRHEIIHAFLFESGLIQNSAECNAWAVNEEMVDWLALQSPKIYRVFAELDIL